MGNFMDLLNILVGGAFGGDWTLFAVLSLVGIAILAFKWRIPAVLAMGLGWGLVYSFYVIQPVSSSNIQFILALLSVGIVVSIISSLLKYGARSQE